MSGPGGGPEAAAPRGGRAWLAQAMQMARFGLVGAANTGVDFAVTNLLAWLWRPASGAAYLGISLVACGLATVNSYLMNRRFTFRTARGQAAAGSVGNFALVALLAAVANSSIFLFAVKYLPDRFGLSAFAAVNVGKLLGVAAGMALSFLGYRFGVFDRAATERFRARFRFGGPEGAASFWPLAPPLLLLALATRGAYLFLTTAVYGDAVSYADVARKLALGHAGEVDAFWSSLYCLWEVPFHAAGLAPPAAAIGAALVPGLALPLVVAYLARELFGDRVAWIAGALAAVEPRLVEYSCNGYAESFYLCAFALGLAGGVAVVRGGAGAATAVFGLGLGVYVGVRNEGLGAAALAGALLWLELPRERPRARLLLGGGAAVALALAVYAALSWHLLGTPGLFSKASNLGKGHAEQLDPRAAALEAYGQRPGGLGGGPAGAPAGAAQAALRLLARWPRNLYYCLERLPGVLLTPVAGFAVLALLLAGRPLALPRGSGQLAVMLLFPLLFYPLVQVEPRLLFPLLVPVEVLGAAGVVVVAAFAAPGAREPLAVRCLVAGLLAWSLGVAAWRGADVESRYRQHRLAAAWLGAHARPDDVVVGCGYGRISATTFLSGQSGRARLVTGDPGALAGDLDRVQGSWLLLYEGFLRDYNPELSPLLEAGAAPPGFDRRAELRPAPGCRVVVFRRQ